MPYLGKFSPSTTLVTWVLAHSPESTGPHGESIVAWLANYNRVPAGIKESPVGKLRLVYVCPKSCHPYKPGILVFGTSGPNAKFVCTSVSPYSSRFRTRSAPFNAISRRVAPPSALLSMKINPDVASAVWILLARDQCHAYSYPKWRLSRWASPVVGALVARRKEG